MSIQTGLHRIGTVAKTLAVLLVGLALYWLLFSTSGIESFVIFGAVPAAALWVVGWIIQGFAK